MPILEGKLACIDQSFTDFFNKKWVAFRLAKDAVKKI